MPARNPSSLVAGLALLAVACVSNPDPGGCPRGGLDTPRRCKRLCVLTAKKSDQRPLPCTCVAECLCWQMPGHSTPPPDEDALAPRNEPFEGLAPARF